ncbi:hypothetical protein [Labilithrix luteola]|uniref:hypothetical protein n=1 Tax=Labilithrix luteola TaxID=1391654 RepID=UPI001F0AE543|nr:hypothetical protein [Labilithrix luteola]
MRGFVVGRSGHGTPVIGSVSSTRSVRSLLEYASRNMAAATEKMFRALAGPNFSPSAATVSR